MAKDESRARAMRAVQAVFERYKILANKAPGGPVFFDYDVMNNVELLDARPEGSVVFRFLMTPKYANINNVMHGGAAGVIFDMLTMTALAPRAKPGFWDFMGGVTRSLAITYLKAVPAGTTVLIKSEVVQQGKTMAFIRSRMTSEDGKTIFCTCEHHKVNAPTPLEHIAARIPWDDELEQEIKRKAEQEIRSKL